MASWEAFLKDIQGLHGFIEQQKKLLNKTALQQMMDSHVQQIIGRANMTCTAEGAAEFTTLISAGPWDDEQKTRLANWISELLMKTGKASKPVKRENQHLESFAGYFSSGDQQCLQDPSVSDHTKLDRHLPAQFVANGFVGDLRCLIAQRCSVLESSGYTTMSSCCKTSHHVASFRW